MLRRMSARPSFQHSRPHPWHGLGTGAEPPTRLTAYVEITAFDLVKYEVDKESGYLRVDRPQRTSSLPPCPYGFVPRTYCGRRVAALMPGASEGDGDPLDICVLTERPIARADVLLAVRVIGGIPMLDAGQADDKILAVLESDEILGGAREIGDVPAPLALRVQHYLATYKSLPGDPRAPRVGAPYGREHAERVVLAAIEDYRELVGA